MAKRLVTKDMVNQAADALVHSGFYSPSVVQVRNHLGVGSFSTIRPLLTSWEEDRTRTAMAAVAMPDELINRAMNFARLAWGIACEEANKSVESTKAKAVAGISLAHRQLTEANGEISRLEVLTGKLEDRVERLEVSLRTTEIALAEARTVAERMPELEKELASARKALEKSQQETREAAVESARLVGRLEQLARQFGAHSQTSRSP